MTQPKTDPLISAALDNARSALAKLEEFCAEPIVNDRDRAGIIQAFEFTFEIFWKLFQKIAQTQGLTANSPKTALKCALQLALISADEEASWLAMLDDRNLTSHTYRRQTAMEVTDHVTQNYVEMFRKSLVRASA